MLVVALLAGLAAVGLAARWMRAQDARHAQIAVAAVDVSPGARLAAPMLTTVDWPRGSVPSGAFTTVAALDGRVVTTSLQRGEPVIEGRLAPVGARAGLSAVVPPGKRAMTVRVNDVIGVAGFALPGTHVDVLVHTRDEDGGAPRGGRAISRIVLERILVLAVAQESDRDASRPKVVSAVTLEVTPAQAERLDLARGVGSLSLVLRNPADDDVVATAGATKVALLGLAAPTQPATHAARRVPVKAAHPVPSRVQRVAKPVAPTPAVMPAPREVVTCVDILAGPSRRIECF
jgi:pilus assembly protein CpaB